jgi:hypothetical protein
MTDELLVSDFADVLRGVTPSKTTNEPGSAAFFGLHEISNGGFAGRFLEPATDLERTVVLQQGDVVVALLGHIGDAAVVSEEASGSVLGRECAAIRLHSGEHRLTPQWLRLVLQSRSMRERAQSMATGTTMPRLSAKALSAFAIQVPPADRQHEAVDRIQKLESAIKAQRDVIKALTSLRDAEIDLLVSDLKTTETPEETARASTKPHVELNKVAPHIQKRHANRIPLREVPPKKRLSVTDVQEIPE